jgi:AraC-like DNA-binding protein
MRVATGTNTDAVTPLRVTRVRTDDWPQLERVAMFRDNVGRDRVLVEPLPDSPFRIHGTLAKLPGLGLVSVRRSALRSDFADGSDRLMINLGGPALTAQAGREVVLEVGDAVCLAGADAGSFTTSRPGQIATVEFPNGSLSRLLTNPRARKIPRGDPALLLLRDYLNAIWASDVLGSHVLRPLATEHIRDLAAVALDASREAEEIARGRGIRVARLQAIKSDIVAGFQTELTLGEMAARHGLSTRYVRMLFESEGTSFSEFVRDERLRRAHRMLLSRRFEDRRISDIAYEVGFNDLSYFNRCFRGRFGCSPGEVRELRWPVA